MNARTQEDQIQAVVREHRRCPICGSAEPSASEHSGDKPWLCIRFLAEALRDTRETARERILRGERERERVDTKILEWMERAEERLDTIRDQILLLRNRSDALEAGLGQLRVDARAEILAVRDEARAAILALRNDLKAHAALPRHG